MITLSEDEVALLKSLLVALRAIKVRDIDKAIVILSKTNIEPVQGWHQKPDRLR